MKNIRLLYLLAFSMLFVTISCNNDDLVEYGSETSQKITDPFLQIKTTVISFQAGTPSYTMEFNVVNGEKMISSVEVYKKFTDAGTGNVSNEALLASYPLDGDGFTNVVAVLTYDDLKAGLTVNDGALPADEVDLAIGSGWAFTFVGKRAEGDIPLVGSVRVAVLSRFAGIYKVIERAYFRIGVSTDPGSPWLGELRFIGSVDATTFSYNDFWGPFAWGGSGFHFKLDESDNSIEVPIPVFGLYSGNRALSCATDVFANVPCAGSDVLIPDDVNGKHVIKLTYGYFTDGSGPREFYEVLEKQ